MRPDTATRLIAQLDDSLAAPQTEPAFELPTDRYTSAAWLARERAAIFAPAPRLAIGSSTLARGACHPHDAAGESVLLVRDRDGVVRGFANACRHRGTRLVDAPCAAKAFVCPYHGWTYDHAGALLHVPHAESFAGVDLATRGLREVPVAERHGAIWIGARDVAPYLATLDAELAALDLDHHVAWRTARTTRACNWKLVIEAFLDGYHLRTLHRDSIYRFFLDAASILERAGDHLVSISARRALRDAPDAPEAAGDPRALVTGSFVLFPATVVIIHPDFVTYLTVHPLAPDRTEFQHVMLVPAARADDHEHWQKSWALIEDGVFQREDLWVCEQIQRGLVEGGTDRLLFGALEHGVRWFHDTIEGRLALSSQA